MDAFLNVLVGLFDRFFVFVLGIGIFSGCVGITDIDMQMANVRNGEKQALFDAHHSIQSIQVNAATFHILHKLEGTCVILVLRVYIQL